MTRSELREKAMVTLYQMEVFKLNNISYDVEELIKENLEIDNDFVKELVFGVLSVEEELIKIANSNMKDWSIDRLDKTGTAILKMAIYEIKYMNTPPIVVINEAIELAKKYSDENVRKIINAVLDKMVNE